MQAKHYQIHPDNPEQRKIDEVVKALKDGALVIFPTDTIYAIGCDMFHTKAIEKLCRFKEVKPEKNDFSIICLDISQASQYIKQLSTPIYRLMKKALPGPYTFIHPINTSVPKLLNTKRKNLGIRIPDNDICLKLVAGLGNPLVSTSLRLDDDIVEYPTDPSEIYEQFLHDADVIVDGGWGNILPSTVLLCSDSKIDVVREGAGDVSILE